MRHRSSCGDDLCSAAPQASPLSTLFALSPFLATFVVVSAVAANTVFPRLSRVHIPADSDGHVLPPSAPPSLQQAHAEHVSRSPGRRIAAATFAITIGLSAVLAELILAEISDLVDADARNLGLKLTVPTLLFLLIALIPFLELKSLIGSGWSFRSSASRGTRRAAWGLQYALFSAWLVAFWSLGRVVPRRAGIPGAGGLPEQEMTALSPVDVTQWLTRACLERIGVIGISLMALLSGFASVSAPWHAFADSSTRRHPQVSAANIARKQAGLDATREMLTTKHHRLRLLQKKAEAATEASSSSGLVAKLVGSLPGLGTGDAAESKTLRREISGLQAVEASLLSSLSALQSRKAAAARAGTTVGRLLVVATYAFSCYCVYRILATSLTTMRRAFNPAASFSTSDPISRFLGLLAKHWDPKLDQVAWARQMSFLLSGVILAASANSVVQTFHIFAKWAPSLLYQAQANLALLIGQITATYVISAALLLRSNLPEEVGSAVGDALESALEPAFVDRWFEGWFLLASAATAAGIWVGRKLAGSRDAWDEWDELDSEEMGQKRS